MNRFILVFAVLLSMTACKTGKTAGPVDHVSTLVGTLSKHSLSTGNTYPAVAMPWGTHFWTPQTGKMGDGWAYVYTADKIRGFKQTHQPSPWMNDYGQFSLMPVTTGPVWDEDRRAGSHTRLKLRLHIITASIWLTMTSLSKCLRQSMLQHSGSHILSGRCPIWCLMHGREMS